MHKVKAGELVKVIKKDEKVTLFELGGVYKVIKECPDNHDQITIDVDGEEGFLSFGEYEIVNEKEAVNSPSHYNAGRVEIIEVIEDITKGYDDAYVGYLIGNAIKYISRAPHKHDTPLEDLRKAEYHIKKAIERLGGK